MSLMIACFLLLHVISSTVYIIVFFHVKIVRILNFGESYAADGNVRVWKDYSLRGKQKLVTAFSSIHGHKPGVRSPNAVVDWQQQCGYLVYGSSLNMFGIGDVSLFPTDVLK